MNNGDKVRQMTNEELVYWRAQYCNDLKVACPEWNEETKWPESALKILGETQA